jgi:hypothetical protein
MLIIGEELGEITADIVALIAIIVFSRIHIRLALSYVLLIANIGAVDVLGYGVEDTRNYEVRKMCGKISLELLAVSLLFMFQEIHLDSVPFASYHDTNIVPV